MASTPNPSNPTAPTTQVGVLSAVDGVRWAFARHLEQHMKGRLDGGLVPDRHIGLVKTFPFYPNVEQRKVVPSISMREVFSEQDDFDPEFVSYDADSETSLIAQEMTGELVVDLWAADPEQRKSLKAAFASAFRPSVDGNFTRSMGGMCIYLALPRQCFPPLYRDRVDVGGNVRVMMHRNMRDIEHEHDGVEMRWQAEARVVWDAHFVTAAPMEIIQIVVDNGVVDGG